MILAFDALLPGYSGWRQLGGAMVGNATGADGVSVDGVSVGAWAAVAGCIGCGGSAVDGWTVWLGYCAKAGTAANASTASAGMVSRRDFMRASYGDKDRHFMPWRRTGKAPGHGWGRIGPSPRIG